MESGNTWHFILSLTYHTEHTFAAPDATAAAHWADEGYDGADAYQGVADHLEVRAVLVHVQNSEVSLYLGVGHHPNTKTDQTTARYLRYTFYDEDNENGAIVTLCFQQEIP